MKLLFDENLSPKLARLLVDLFPDSVHVRDVGLKAADDSEVWKHAQDTHSLFARRIQTCTNEVFCWDSLQKWCGSDWVTVLLQMWKCCFENMLQ
jgi:hypothetical protein